MVMRTTRSRRFYLTAVVAIVVLAAGCGDGESVNTGDAAQQPTESSTPAKGPDARRGVYPDPLTTDYEAIAAEYRGGGRRELAQPTQLATAYLRELFSQRSGQRAEVSRLVNPLAVDVPNAQQLSFTVRIPNRPDLTGHVGLERYRDGFWYVGSVISDVFNLYELNLDGSNFTGQLLSSVPGVAHLRVQDIQSRRVTRDDTQQASESRAIVLDSVIDGRLGSLFDVTMETSDGGLYVARFIHG